MVVGKQTKNNICCFKLLKYIVTVHDHHGRGPVCPMAERHLDRLPVVLAKHSYQWGGERITQQRVYSRLFRSRRYTYVQHVLGLPLKNISFRCLLSCTGEQSPKCHTTPKKRNYNIRMRLIRRHTICAAIKIVRVKTIYTFSGLPCITCSSRIRFVTDAFAYTIDVSSPYPMFVVTF